MRTVTDVAYALLAEAADAADRVAAPAYLVAGVKPEDVEAMSQRSALDDWLSAPTGRQAKQEEALMRHLQAVG